MTTTTVVKVSAAIEMATGVTVIMVPDLFATLLLGTGLSGSGIAVARLTGIALICLAIASWPGKDSASAYSIRALFAYNLLVAVYLVYLRIGGGFAGFLLWPACAVHGVVAVLLSRPASAPGTTARI